MEGGASCTPSKDFEKLDHKNAIKPRFSHNPKYPPQKGLEMTEHLGRILIEKYSSNWKLQSAVYMFSLIFVLIKYTFKILLHFLSSKEQNGEKIYVYLSICFSICLSISLSVFISVCVVENESFNQLLWKSEFRFLAYLSQQKMTDERIDREINRHVDI